MTEAVDSLQTLTLRSAELEVSVMPRQGGRIASLRSLPSGREFLTQSHGQPEVISGMQARFEQGYCAGIGECLPSIGPCGPETKGGPVPDHGDFWQLPWHARQTSANHAKLRAEAFSRPLRFEKEVTVQGNSLHLRYGIRNLSQESASFLYACHPLFEIQAGDRILLPDEVQSLRLDYTRAGRLGTKGTLLRWPVTEPQLDLSCVQAFEAQTADMLYTARLSQGRCALEREGSGERLEIRFETKTLPYLGVWLCYGGWPGDGARKQQYAVALEPTTAPYNTLKEAQEAEQATVVAPGCTYSCAIEFCVVSQRT